MNSLILASILGLVLSQPPHNCVYEDAGGSPFKLNLTSIAQYRFERTESDNFVYYYTPCHNGEKCFQGNAQYYTNVAQYKAYENQCLHYLSIDHHENPTYRGEGGAWEFEYTDGELCEQTNQPRRTTIYYQCFEELNHTTLYSVTEPRPCEYVMEVRTPLACVPENQYNEQCKWRVKNGENTYYVLDLSPLNKVVLSGRLRNGYYQQFSPCRDGLQCYQQIGQTKAMGVIDNYATGTCDHYSSFFESGRVQPALHGIGTSQQHWSFHYWGGETCPDGTPSFQEVRYFCNKTATNPEVIGSYVDGDCRFYMNVSTSHACL